MLAGLRAATAPKTVKYYDGLQDAVRLRFNALVDKASESGFHIINQSAVNDLIMPYAVEDGDGKFGYPLVFVLPEANSTSCASDGRCAVSVMGSEPFRFRRPF